MKLEVKNLSFGYQKGQHLWENISPFFYGKERRNIFHSRGQWSGQVHFASEHHWFPAS